MILAITMNPAIDRIYFVKNYQLDKVHRPLRMIDSPGGKGLNVARVAAALGEPVKATGLVGGANGDFIVQAIKPLGIEPEFVAIKGHTRICINVTDVDAKTCTEILEPGPEVSESEVASFFHAYNNLLHQVDVITISGSLPLGVASDFYHQLIVMANDKNKKVLLDTSQEAFEKGILARPYMIKPNRDEVKAYLKGKPDTIDNLCEVLDSFYDLGIALPIISLGEQGALCKADSGFYRVVVPKVNVVNPVGSGDAFVAGCAVGLSRGYDIQRLLQLASACGGVNACHPQTGFIVKTEVEALMPKIRIEKL